MRQPSPVNSTVAAATAGVVAAVGSALCCVGPLVAVFLGLSGAGLAATFEPLRPYFVAGTALSLGVGFALVHREERRACEPGNTVRVVARPAADAVGAVVRDSGRDPAPHLPWWSKFVLG